MNNSRKTTITTLDVAEMMEVEHSEILKKLEGTKRSDGSIKQIGIIPVLSKGKIPLADYFMESAYIDAQGKKRKCYDVTKLGCDFLANKFTGEKGIIFTARYVQKFNEMEDQIKQMPLTEHPGEVANLIKVLGNRMDKQGSAPYKSTEMAQMVCEQYGIQLPDDFVKAPEYEQMKLPIYGEEEK